MMYELPPQTQGTAEQQLAALRDYLVRLARDLDRAGNSDAVVTEIAGKASEKARSEAVQAIQDQAQSIKAIIVKNADQVKAYADSLITNLSSVYVAQSDFGTYQETVQTEIQQNAQATTETYNYAASIESAFTSYTEALNGQIRRGIIEDPVTHALHLGIAISENLNFTGQTQAVGGVTYYELDPTQTLGLYTAHGWEFWTGGQKIGWFSSDDKMLHVPIMIVESTLQLGDNWQITTNNGFGLRYTGA